MTSKSPGPQKCRLILNQTLVIQLSRPGNVPDDFWMYDSGYMIFQVSELHTGTSYLAHKAQPLSVIDWLLLLRQELNNNVCVGGDPENWR